MTFPSGRPRRIDPDDLARRVADRLADQDPTEPAVSNRVKFLGTSAVAGLVIIALAGGLILAVVSGFGWLAEAIANDEPIAREHRGGGVGLFETTSTIEADASAPGPTTTTLGGPFATTPTTTALPSFSPVPTFPPRSPTTTVVVGTSTTTQPTTTTTQPATTSTSTTTQPTTTTTQSATTTTAEPPTTTTTEPPTTTTTTEPTTTTTEPPTTTTTTEPTTSTTAPLDP